MVLDDLSSGRRENVPQAAAFEKADVQDAAAIERIVAGFRPDVICHQAAQISVSVSAREPVRDAQINVVGTLNVLEAACRHKVGRVVFASTGGAIYGQVPEPKRANLDTPPLPLSPYACSKFAVEQYLRSFSLLRGLKYSILRYANVYGPRQDPHGEAGVVAIFSERVIGAKPMTIYAMKKEGDDGCVRDYTFVADVVRANIRALWGESDAPIVNVSTGVGTSTLGLLKTLESVSGKRAEYTFSPPRTGDIERSVLEPHPGDTQRTLAEGLTETVAWFRKKLGVV